MVIFAVAVFFAMLGAFANSVMDKLSFHYGKSIFPGEGDTLFGRKPSWWNPSISWLNKYKDYPSDKRARYIGAKTWLVWTTDAWHFAKMIMISSFQITIAVSIVSVNNWPFWTTIVCVAVQKIIFGSIFTLFFDKLLVKK